MSNMQNIQNQSQNMQSPQISNQNMQNSQNPSQINPNIQIALRNFMKTIFGQITSSGGNINMARSLIEAFVVLF